MPIPPRPKVAQRQPLQPKHVHPPHRNCGVTGCAPMRSVPTPNGQNRGSNPNINQHSQHLQRQDRSMKPAADRMRQHGRAQNTPAQPKMAPSRPITTAKKSFSSRQSVLQRMEVPSRFDPSKAAKKGQWVVTQVDSELGGMFGHSELFIESYSGTGAKTNYKIHVQTLHQTRVDILVLPGDVNLTHVRGSKSYLATDDQVQKIWMAARTIQHKMEQGIITYAEIFPDRKPDWKDATQQGKVEMSCKSVTDTLLIEAGLRQSYGGRIVNHPGDLE